MTKELIHQSFLTGEVLRIPYQRLLEAILTDEELIINYALSSNHLTSIPIRDMTHVEVLRNLTAIGVKIYYRQSISEGYIVLLTRKYKEWGRCFEHMRIHVDWPTGWL